MKHGVLKNWHPMIGYDRHIPWPPGSPAPAPAPAFYITFSLMNGWGITASMANDVLSNYLGLTMLKVTDIGPMIPHVGPPSTLLLIEIPLSSSKSYFGSSRYQSKGKPVAAGLLFVANPNLNCGTPLPTPTGVVLAITTHRVDMSWGDIFSGLLQMAFDFALMWMLNKIGKVGGPAFNFIQRRVFNRFLPGFVAAAVRDGGDRAIAEAFAGIQAASKTEAYTKAINWAVAGGLAVVGLLIGSPMGVDASTPGLYGSYSSDHPSVGASKGDHRGGPGDVAGGFLSGVGEQGGQALGKYLDGGNPAGYPKDIGSRGVTD
jgi:hypothetical protein